jgi:hypothetical protein
MNPHGPLSMDVLSLLNPEGLFRTSELYQELYDAFFISNSDSQVHNSFRCIHYCSPKLITIISPNDLLTRLFLLLVYRLGMVSSCIENNTYLRF